MASTPFTDTRSPLTILNNLPKEHEKAIKQAFYNTAANIFMVIAAAAGIAVYFILEAFLRPLLWAVLCGAFLNPFKRSLANVLRTWLSGLRKSETPFVLGLVLTPIKIADNSIDSLCNLLFQNFKLLIGAGLAATAVYVLCHFGPVWKILSFIQGLFFFLYDLIGYFGSLWIWTLAIAYLVALFFLWTPESRNTLRYLSIPVWLLLILHIAATAGILRVPLLILMGVVIVVGFVSEQNEILRQQQEGRDTNRKSVFESFLSVLSGESSTAEAAEDTEKAEETDKTDVPTVTGTPDKVQEVLPAVKPDTLNVQPDVLRRPHLKKKLVMTPTPQTEPAKSLSDQCFIALFWAIVLTWLWMHMWLVSILLPVPLAIWAIKKLCLKLLSPDGPFGERVKPTRQAISNWIRDRKEVLMPKWLRGVGRLVMKGDQNMISMLESSVDKATSVLFILLLLIGSLMFSIFFAVQVQQESMYLVKTTSNLLNNSLHPEIASWLPNNDDVQSAMDSMVSNAYVYGRNWIASKVRDLVNGPTEDNNTQIETQVLEMWDRLYESWLARASELFFIKNDTQARTQEALPTKLLSDALNATSSSLTTRGSTPFDITNFTSIWNVVTEGDGFNFSDIISFVKENIGTFLSVLDSIWLVLKGNMSLVISVMTSTLSMVFGGGTALLNFVISSIIFLTTLFYLLASSGDQYKPVEWASSMSPPTGGGSNTFGQAVQDAISGVFMASLKMAAFYGLYTWLTHSLFGVNIVFIPSALAAVFGAIPFVGTYLAAIPAVLELWLVQDQFVLAVLLLVFHFLPSYVVDTAIYSEIKGGHPYMTGLAIAGGMYWIGLEGAIFGPIILCFLVVLVNVYSSMMKPESPSYMRSHSVL